ncbi:hypothetical protein [Edaphocola flava]|uniref:hypothetical protein n=1 Tax=Edaphocola flava TaxID=2499629 RepID=UPI00100BA32A|nr:hypothetical protein [Edaphocola flava]
MKNIIAGIICLIGFVYTATAQKTIKGKVYEWSNGLDTIDGEQVDTEYYEECASYVIFLKEKEDGRRKDTFAWGSTSAFELTLDQQQLKKYKFLEFVKFPSGDKNDIVAIEKVKSDSIDVELYFVVYGQKLDPNAYVMKPAIYLYPEQETAVSIKHTFKGTVLNTFPEYKDGWNVVASPDGKLKNKADGRNYNYLFWDGSTHFGKEHFVYKDGFYVSRKEIIPFLQQRLAQMGLNETEINDFIVYWLPALSKNETNFIHFWVNDDIDHSSTLDVEPKPETVIRVFMEYKAYDGTTPKLPEQQLQQTLRKGFVLVEWGGGAIGTSKVE